MKSEELIQSLIEKTRQIINQAEQLKEKEDSALNWRERPDSWSILECLEHLNLYGDYYLPVMENAMRSSNLPAVAEFKPGKLGNYFAKSMLPKEKLNKMKTFKDKNPLHSNLDRKTIDRFLNQQMKLLDLLDKARRSNLNKIRITITISRFIKLKLGDTLHFVVNHEVRHMDQIKRVEKAFQA